MTTLSPAAQAVLDEFLDTPGEVPMPMWDYGRDLGAALRVAADQARSQEITRSDWTKQTWVLKSDILAIATELEAQP